MWQFATKTGFRTPEKRGSGVLDERGLGTPNPKPVWFLRPRFCDHDGVLHTVFSANGHIAVGVAPPQGEFTNMCIDAARLLQEPGSHAGKTRFRPWWVHQHNDSSHCPVTGRAIEVSSPDLPDWPAARLS